MESMIPLEQSERRRRAVISLFVAATFGMAAILSLPVIRLVPFPFRLPSPAEVLGPPPTVVVPVPNSGFNPTSPELIHRQRPVAVEDGGRRAGSKDRPGDPRDEGGADIALAGEPVAGPPIHKEKVPVPPADGEHVSDEKAPATEESGLAQKDSLDE